MIKQDKSEVIDTIIVLWAKRRQQQFQTFAAVKTVVQHQISKWLMLI